MFSLILMIFLVVAVTVTMLLSMRAAFFFFVFLYGIYPKFLALGLGEQGFALSGTRAVISLLLLGYLGRLLINDPYVRAGLGTMKQEKVLVLAITGLILAKVFGNVSAGQMSLGSFAALADESLLVAFTFVLAVTYLRTVRDIYVLFACIAGSVIVNEMAVVVEFLRGGSVFYDVVDIQYETATERNLVAGRIRDGTYRIMGLMPNPLVLASVFCISLPGLLALLSQDKDALFKSAAFIALIGIGPALLATFARGGIALGILIGVSAIYVLATRRFDRPLRVTTTMLTGSAVLLVMILIGREIALAIAAAGGEQGIRSAQSRIFQYGAALPVLLDHPIFGVGYARNYDALLGVGNIDGHYLRTALQGGIAGLTAIAWAMLRGIKMSASASVTVIVRGLGLAALAVRASILVIAVLMVFYSQHNTAAYLALFLAAAVTVGTLRRPEIAKQQVLPLAKAMSRS